MIIHECDQNSEEWALLHAGKPTACNFSKLITSTGTPSKSMKAYAEQLAGELYAGKWLDSWEGNKYTQYGHDTESEAVSAYELINDIDTESVGFITDDLEQWGCSPDRLVGEDGLLEIKCLPKGHIEAIRYHRKTGNVPTKFVQQVQGQMLITGRQWCDLMFYHPDLPKVIIRVTPDEKVVAGLSEQLRACIAERDLIYKELRDM